MTLKGSREAIKGDKYALKGDKDILKGSGKAFNCNKKYSRATKMHKGKSGCINRYWLINEG